MGKWFHLAIVISCLIFILIGKPPARPQSAAELRKANASRDISIVQLNDFQSQQQKLNERLERHLEANDSDIKELKQQIDDQNSHWNWIQGGLAGLAALSGLAFLAQFFNKKE